MNKFEMMREQLKGGVKVVSAPQLFPTPRAVVAMLLHRADIYSSHTVLDPSAGTGAIMDAVKHLCNSVVGVEINHGLCEALTAKGHKVIHEDFLDFHGFDKYFDDADLFDRILMNPPFKDGQDIAHVQHAFNNCLADGGRLVAIMCAGPFFRQDKKSTAFRAWIDELGAEVEDLPPDAFKDSGTGVNTKIVTIDKG